MRIVFFGSPAFAVPTLGALIAAPDIEVAAVVTQPDKPAGRGRRITSPPVKTVAAQHDIPVRQPRSIRGKKFALWCEEIAADFFVVVAYGKILPKRVLDAPHGGCVNLHASLLPKYRGAAPINWALAHGETITGNTTMLMDEGMDTGPMLLSSELEICPSETTGELAPRLANDGADLLVKTLRELRDGNLSPTPQNHDEATYAPLLERETGCIDWTQTAEDLFNRWRGFSPWPGIYSTFRDLLFKCRRVAVAEEMQLAEPGTITVEKNRLLVSCGNGTTLEVLKAQVPGKRSLPATDLINGLRITSGERLQ